MAVCDEDVSEGNALSLTAVFQPWNTALLY